MTKYTYSQLAAKIFAGAGRVNRELFNREIGPDRHPTYRASDVTLALRTETERMWNWFAEQDALLDILVYRGDADRILEWADRARRCPCGGRTRL